MPHTSTGLPVFSEIDTAAIEQDLEQLLTENRTQLRKLIVKFSEPTWVFMQHLEELEDRLARFWAVIEHFHAVQQDDRMRQAYQCCLPKLIAYQTEIGQHRPLYRLIEQWVHSPTFTKLDDTQQKVIQNRRRDFHLNGVDLEPNDQQCYRQIKTRLAHFSTQFEEHLLDATASWSKLVSKKEELSNLPAYVVTAFEKAAQLRGLSGWLLTLDQPCYSPLLNYADNRALRAEVYHAYVTRASDQDHSSFDNSLIMLEILTQRHALSQLLGFANYAELSLATDKTIKDPEEVLSFLQQLLQYVRPKALEEWQTLQQFAVAQGFKEELQAWDVPYYSEKFREQTFSISEAKLQSYFPINRVLIGLFQLTKYLFSMTIHEIEGGDVWHPQVRLFGVYDAAQELRGQFYLDLYARPRKRESAWMDSCQQRRKQADNAIQPPIAFLTCNFTSPKEGDEALLTHDEVLTLFHEFGHGLQHVLTKVDWASVSGIQGVAWDAVEFPSQFLECFAWEPQVLALISAHHQTGEPLPTALMAQMQAARNFQAGLQLLRQIELALFDFHLHWKFDPSQGYDQIPQNLAKIRCQTKIAPVPTFNRWEHSFSHIFSGNYAAGYYSYLWAEVLACDAFSQFSKAGIFNTELGQRFLRTILEQGGAVDALMLFEQFQGRAPKIQALLQHWEILC